MPLPTLIALPGRFAIHRSPLDAVLPEGIFAATPGSVIRDGESLTVVCASGLAIPGSRCEDGWACIQVAGPLDFGLTGILAGLSSTLAAAGISIFALSSFDTDFLLFKATHQKQAHAALRAAGYPLIEAAPAP
jgi:uncharacterized protein